MIKFDGALARNIGIPVVVGIAGFFGHALVEVPGMTKTVDQHTTQLRQLWEGQAETHKSLQDLALSQMRIEGKLDVTNQKLNDQTIMSSQIMDQAVQAAAAAAKAAKAAKDARAPQPEQ